MLARFFHPYFRLSGLVAACLLLACSLTAMGESGLANFRIGKVTQNPAKQENRIAPMAELLARRIDADKAGTVYAQSIDAMVEKFRQGEVELFTGSLWEGSVLVNAGLGEAIAIKHRDGTRGYHSLIIVRADSGIHELADLAGKLVAFEDPDSTSAFRLPALNMRRAGLSLRESLERPENGQVVHYRFSNSEQISSVWLYRKTVDAIALSDSDWGQADKVPEFQKNLYRIIHRSAEFPRAIEVVRKDLPEPVKQKLARTLLSPNLSINHAQVLDGYHKTSGFSAVDPQTRQSLSDFADKATPANQVDN